LAVWLVARRNGPPLLMMGLKRPSTRWVVITAVAAAAVLADRLALLLLVGPVSTTPADVLPAHLGPAALTGGWLTRQPRAGRAAAPVEEEILYRRVLFGRLHGWAGTVPAILDSAAIFAAVLTSLGATNTALAFIGGAALAWIYTRSRSLLPAIVLHATWNTTKHLGGSPPRRGVTAIPSGRRPGVRPASAVRRIPCEHDRRGQRCQP
jgi:membrane protease YdiL (CAAX protease family)